MGDKVKRLCKWKREKFVEDADVLKDIVSHPKYVCRRCGRAAKAREWLCKPERI